LNSNNPKLIKLNEAGQSELAVVPGETGQQLTTVSGPLAARSLDVLFPVLHGPYGEDGTIQGMLKLAGIPFVGAGVLGSAVGMDKDVLKRLLREAKLPTVKFIVVHRRNKDTITFERVREELGIPLFVKPANLGSSVGISKVTSIEDFRQAIELALSFDNKILIEEGIKGREIEVAVLGNEDPIASVPGEIIPHHDFYSYEAKYIDENGAALEVPAKLSPALIADAKDLAVKAFKTLECEGMARVDFFLVDNKSFLLNEINTIPGFTKISMYPRLWEASGIPYSELIDRLIKLALERHSRDKKLRVSYEP
jgi:D-alanine-D-alanine ligase